MGARVAYVGAVLVLLVAGCSQPSVGDVRGGSPVDAPCAFVQAGAVAAVIGSDVAPKPEVGEPEHLCRFLDPSTQEHVVTLSVQDGLTTDAEVAEFLAQIAQTYPDDATVTEVQLDGDRLGTIYGTAFTYDHRESGWTTSLGFSVPPYFFIVHVAQAVGDLDDAVAIAEATLAILSP